MDEAARAELFAERIDGLFHLAATLTADAERDFERGMAVNINGFVDLLERCRSQGGVRLVFSSSNAAFGGPLPEVVPDEIQQRPQTSYGTQKVIAELLLDDYTRRGFLDGRGLRLPVVLLRPATAAKTVSSAISAIVCEPLHGRPAASPFPPTTRLPVASVTAVANALIRVFNMPSAALGAVRTVNICALSVTIGDMVDALERRIGAKARDLVEWRVDQQLTTMVGSMASGMNSIRGAAYGVTADATFDEIIEDYVRHLPPGDRIEPRPD
jgi:nucleoside-diphosphate-sugar epimerase